MYDGLWGKQLVIICVSLSDNMLWAILKLIWYVAFGVLFTV